MAVFEPPPPLRKRTQAGYELAVHDPLGRYLRSFTRDIPGISGDITASASPLTGCIGLTFNARPDVVPLEGCEVLKLYLNDGDGLTPVFYGAVTDPHPAEPAEGLLQYAASAEDLLDAWCCDDTVYTSGDVATAAFDLASRCRHPALRVRAADFPATGVPFAEPFSRPGIALGDVLAELAELAATGGAVIGSGVDAEGFVFFRPNPHRLRVAYYEDIFRDLPSKAPRRVATSFEFVFGSAPSLGDSWAGAYRPRPLTYVTTPDEALHAAYMRRVGMNIPANAWTLVPKTAQTSVGFTNAANAVDADPATFATRSGTSGKPYLQLNNVDPWVFGVFLRYLTTEDVPEMTLRVSAQHATGAGGYYEAPLPKSEGEIKTLPIKLPPAITTAQGAFQYFSSFRITVPPGGTFQLFEAHLMRVDTNNLDALGMQNLQVPSRVPQQLTPLRDTPDGPKSYIAPLAPIVEVPGTPRGDQVGVVPTVRYEWYEEAEAVGMVIDLGQSAGGEDDEFLVIQESLERDFERRQLKEAVGRRL